MVNLVEGADLQKDCWAFSRCMSMMTFSCLQSERRVKCGTDEFRRSSDMKSVLVKLLVVNFRQRFGGGGSAPRSIDVESPCNEGSLLSRSRGTADEAPALEWMKEGFVEAEFYDEVQKEQDGTSVAIAPLKKKRKFSPDAKFRASISKAVIQAVYKKVNFHFRMSRNEAKKLVSTHLGFIIIDGVNAEVTIDPVNPVSCITLIAQTYALKAASASPDDDYTNTGFLEALELANPQFLATFAYTVNVEGENKTLVKRINLIRVALNYCIAFTLATSPTKLLRGSPDSFRMVYVVALSFHELVAKYEDRRLVSNHPEFKDEWNALIKRWKELVPKEDARDKELKRKSTLTMNLKEYTERNEADTGNEEAEDTNIPPGDKVQREVERFEMRF
jgi:hypothetical protein